MRHLNYQRQGENFTTCHLLLQAAEELLAKFNLTSDQLMNKSAEAQAARAKAEELRDNVLAFEEDARSKLEELQGMCYN